MSDLLVSELQELIATYDSVVVDIEALIRRIDVLGKGIVLSDNGHLRKALDEVRGARNTQVIELHDLLRGNR